MPSEQDSASEPDSHTIEVQAVGRPFQLGMLYDCRSDRLVPGITLWDKYRIESDVSVKKSSSTSFGIKTSDRMSDKADALDIDASLKMSFMSGLIQVSGSAKYLDDKVSSNNQERVTFNYNCKTKFEQLNMGTLANITYGQIIDDKMATHVVTGMQYGANVVFIFDKQHDSSESKREVSGQLHALVKTLPTFEIDGDAKVKLNEKDEIISNNLTCTFHGDVRPKYNPTTFEEAVKVYKELNDLIGEDGQPLTIYLYPLDRLDSNAAKLVRDISETVILEVEYIFEDFQKISRRCNDLKRNAIFPVLLSFVKQLEIFERLVKEQQLVFQKNILPILPKIKGGDVTEEESGLTDVILELSQSVFNYDSLNNWIKEKETQLKDITNQNEFIEGNLCISSDDLNSEVRDPDNEHILCFMLEIPAMEEQMAAMHKHSDKTYTALLDKETDGEDISQAVNTHESARRFREFYNANKTRKMEKGTKTSFFISEVSSNVHEVSGSIVHYKSGKVKTTSFLPPSRPDNLEVLQISKDSVSLKWNPSARGSEEIEEYEIEYQAVMEQGSSNENNIIATGNTSTEYVFTGNSTTEYVLSSLIPSTEYRFKCRAVVPSGVSEYCDASELVETLPESSDLQNMLHNLKKNMESKILMITEAKEVLRNLLRGDRKVYARHTNGNVVYYSEIADTTTNFCLKEFSTTIPPSEKSIFLEFDILKTLVTGCFLEMSHQDRSIGVLEILFSPENPKLVDQMMMLCSGSNGSDRWRKSGFDGFGDQGEPGERVGCWSYCSDETGGKSNSALHQVEEDCTTPKTEGIVVGWGAQNPGFLIVTRTQANATWPNPLIGHLTATALRELQTAIANNTIKEVVFSKCGLLIDATSTTA